MYQSDSEAGVLEALLRAVRSDGWEVVGAVNWKDIRKLRVNAPGEGDRRNVLAAGLKAVEAGADVLAFTRDRDRDETREEDIERAIEEAAGESLDVIGGVAIETIEGWLIAVSGESKSESVRHPEEQMARLGLEAKRAPSYVQHVETHGLAKIPADAASLRRWLERAGRVLRTSPPPP